jgi:hypothetical protein
MFGGATTHASSTTTHTAPHPAAPLPYCGELMSWPARRVLAIIAPGGILLALAGWLINYAVEKHRFDGNLKKIISLLPTSDQAEPEQRFDAVRHFVNRNSRHAKNEEFRRLLGHENRMVEELIAYATGQRSEPVPLLCGARSNIMSAVLRKLGYETRIVALFDTDDDELPSHTFLEVKNPETGSWETQDPDFDLYWISKSSGERVSLADGAEDLSAIEPCHRPGECGADTGKAASVLPDYLDILCVTNMVNGKRFCRFTTRAKPDRTFARNGDRGRFCDLMPNRCALGFEPASAH